MPTLNGPITPDGALVTLAIGVSEKRRQILQRLNFPVPMPSKVRALLDPGSEVSFADAMALQHLGITPHTHLPLLSSASGTTVNVLPVRYLSVTLLDAADQPMMYWPIASVYATTYDPAAVVHGVFGRDLLADCVFLYDGKSGVFSLTV
jgi:hypothetical protein